MTTATLFWTYASLRDKILADLDLAEESFISPSEMMTYANEAVDRGEQLVTTIYEDYFLDYHNLSVVAGTDEYDLPSTIYAHKIRRLVYRSGSKVYKIKRAGDWKKFEAFDEERVNNSSVDIVGYFIRNSTPGSPKILFLSVPQENGTARIWFIRQANRFVGTSDILDIPEAANFVLAYMKYRCIYKETHGEMTAGLQTALGELEKEEKLLVDTLTAMVPDAENNIEADYTHYEEMS